MANGKGGADPRDREIRELKKEVEGRDQVIGELTIANRIPKKTAHRPTNWGKRGAAAFFSILATDPCGDLPSPHDFLTTPLKRLNGAWPKRV